MPALGLALHGEQRTWATPALGLLGSIPTTSGNLLTHWQGRLLLVEPHEAVGNALRLVFMFFQSSVFAIPLAVVLQQTLGSLVTGSPLTRRGPPFQETGSAPRRLQSGSQRAGGLGLPGPWPAGVEVHTLTCISLSCVLWGGWPCHLPSLPHPLCGSSALHMLALLYGPRPGLDRSGQRESPRPGGGGGPSGVWPADAARRRFPGALSRPMPAADNCSDARLC